MIVHLVMVPSGTPGTYWPEVNGQRLTQPTSQLF
jgi:hypothetical protein